MGGKPAAQSNMQRESPEQTMPRAQARAAFCARPERARRYVRFAARSDGEAEKRGGFRHNFSTGI